MDSKQKKRGTVLETEADHVIIPNPRFALLESLYSGFQVRCSKSAFCRVSRAPTYVCVCDHVIYLAHVGTHTHT